MTADLFALIARLEAAEAGDQDLSLEVNIALEGGEPVGKTANYVMEPYWAIRRPNPTYVGGFENGPNYPVTTSLDAALALAERVLGNGPCVLHRNGPSEWGFTYVDDDTAYAATPALSVCAAILRAKQGEG